MARLLLNGEWFDSVAPQSIYESDFEKLLIANAEYLYPSFHMIRYKRMVCSPYGDGKPDLALIERQYRSWWIVEVELGNHPLREHVERQVAIFSAAQYGTEDAEYISTRNPHLDCERIVEMMRGAQPRVLVLVNQTKPEWSASLNKYDAIVGVAEIFRSRRNYTILRVNGTHPEPLGRIVSVCTVDMHIRNFLVVESPANIGIPPNGHAIIWYEGCASEWTRTDSGTKVWLRPVQRYPLAIKVKSFNLFRGADGQLVFEERQ